MSPGRIKRPVASACAMAWLTAIIILYLSNIVSIWADFRSLCVAIVCRHVVLHVGNAIGLCGSWFGGLILLIEESSDSGSVRAMTSLAKLLWTMVLSSSSSFSL